MVVRLLVCLFHIPSLDILHLLITKIMISRSNKSKLQHPNSKELLHDLLRHVLSPFLELSDQLLQLLDQNLLHFSGEHSSALVLLLNPHQLLRVLQEILQILERNVLRQIGAQSPLLLLRLPSSAHRVLVNLPITPYFLSPYLVLNHIRRVRHVDARVLARRAHFRPQSRQRRNEFAVNQRRFELFQTHRHVPRHPEVRILVDRARNQTTKLVGSQHPRE